MPRERQKSRILEKAQLRTYGLHTIDPNIDFGEMKQLIEKLRSKILATSARECYWELPLNRVKIATNMN
ncbi:hypothetical protein [Tolypothrix sp. PCC 7910]|uniref:hypothetical protein n=1 Tax=Tolypothrix sp. PCC 7910 TaxID=2099387 RepID=UPI00353027A1